MSTLSTLKLSDASPRQQLSTVDRKRRKLLEQLDLQIKAADSAVAGETYQHEVKRWVRDEGSADKILVTQVRPVRQWWWTNPVGIVMLSLRQGNRVIEVAPGKNSIEVGTLADLPNTLELLRKAVAEGELDGQLDTADVRRTSKAKQATKS